MHRVVKVASLKPFCPSAFSTAASRLTFALPLLAKDTGIAVDLVREAKLSAPAIGLAQSLIQSASDLSEADSDFLPQLNYMKSWSKITLE